MVATRHPARACGSPTPTAPSTAWATPIRSARPRAVGPAASDGTDRGHRRPPAGRLLARRLRRRRRSPTSAPAPAAPFLVPGGRGRHRRRQPRRRRALGDRSASRPSTRSDGRAIADLTNSCPARPATVAAAAAPDRHRPVAGRRGRRRDGLRRSAGRRAPRPRHRRPGRRRAAAVAAPDGTGLWLLDEVGRVFPLGGARRPALGRGARQRSRRRHGAGMSRDRRPAPHRVPARPLPAEPRRGRPRHDRARTSPTTSPSTAPCG